MPTRGSAPTGAPCWIDLTSSDTDASRDFYGPLLGWEFEEMGDDYGGYINALRDGRRVAGLMGRMPDSEGPDVWSVYLAVADADAAADRADSHGASVIVPAMDVRELGRMAVIADPGGAAVGMWQPAEHPGFLTWDEVGTPAWFELLTRDYDTSVEFYRTVFGWETEVMSNTAEFRYTTLGGGDDALAGIMDADDHIPTDVPAHWATYFRVADTDDALVTVEKLGGAVVTPAADSPYGRLAGVTDPTGAGFRLVSG